MAAKLLRAVILGPPGAGKGTISTRIKKDFLLRYVASGDILRHHVEHKTRQNNNIVKFAEIKKNVMEFPNFKRNLMGNLLPAFGKEAKEHMVQGRLVPDELISKLIFSELSSLGGSDWLLDGFPRTIGQAKELDGKKEKLTLVLNLDIPFEIIIERIQGRWMHAPSGRIYHTEFNPPKRPGVDDITGEPLIQRVDDKAETVRARLNNYEKLTKPLLNFYQDKGILANFKGKYSNEIWPKVHKVLSEHIKPQQYTHYQ